MFDLRELSSETLTSRNSHTLRSAFATLAICVVALLAQGPAFATDPLEADPDPDYGSFTTTITIFVASLDEVDIASLAPGRYLIVVVDPNGPDQTVEILVS
ncbi:MAG: hypothetical protein AAF560_12450 [Acidobacteriota bacterium]